MAAVAPCPPKKKVPPLFTLGSGVTLQPEFDECLSVTNCIFVFCCQENLGRYVAIDSPWRAASPAYHGGPATNSTGRVRTFPRFTVPYFQRFQSATLPLARFSIHRR